MRSLILVLVCVLLLHQPLVTGKGDKLDQSLTALADATDYSAFSHLRINGSHVYAYLTVEQAYELPRAYGSVHARDPAGTYEVRSRARNGSMTVTPVVVPYDTLQAWIAIPALHALANESAVISARTPIPTGTAHTAAEPTEGVAQDDTPVSGDTTAGAGATQAGTNDSTPPTAAGLAPPEPRPPRKNLLERITEWLRNILVANGRSVRTV